MMSLSDQGGERMYEWHRLIQLIIGEIDECIRRRDDEALTLRSLAQKLGYSGFHMTKQFRSVTGMSLREYLRARRLAFALVEVRDTQRRLLDIALDYGFSSHEAFTRAFRREYGVTPAAYRRKPVAVVLRTRIMPFDRYVFGMGEIGMIKSSGKINVYFTTIAAHRLLYIRNAVSNGYWDFWQHHANIPGQDCHTVCGLLDSIPGKLDDMGSGNISSGAGHIMAYESSPEGGSFPCYPVPRFECYGVRLPADYEGPVPEGMLLRDVAEGAYIVFEHGPFDYEQENRTVEFLIDAAQEAFDWDSSEFVFDEAPGRMSYFYHDCERYWKELWPVRKR